MQSSSATHYEFFTNLLQWSDQAQFAAATSSPQNLIGFKHLNDKGLFLAYASCPRLGHGPKRNVDTVSVNRVQDRNIGSWESGRAPRVWEQAGETRPPLRVRAAPLRWALA